MYFFSVVSHRKITSGPYFRKTVSETTLHFYSYTDPMLLCVLVLDYLDLFHHTENLSGGRPAWNGGKDSVDF